MTPKRLIRYIDKETFNKSKIFYKKSNLLHGEEKADISINLEEYEALRLYHYKHLPQAKCAKELNISQPTFSRILRSALDKLVNALVEEKNFEILGGNVTYKDWIGWGCLGCDNEWLSGDKPDHCPKCKKTSIFKLKKLASFFID